MVFFQCTEELSMLKYQLRNALEATLEDADSKFAEVMSGLDSEVAELIELVKTGSVEVSKLEEALKTFTKTFSSLIGCGQPRLGYLKFC